MKSITIKSVVRSNEQQTKRNETESNKKSRFFFKKKFGIFLKIKLCVLKNGKIVVNLNCLIRLLY